MTSFSAAGADPTGAAALALRLSLDEQQAAIARVRLQFEGAVARLPRSGASVRAGPAISTGAAPWKGPARLAFEASLYELERLALEVRDSLAIAEEYSRIARDALDNAR